MHTKLHAIETNTCMRANDAFCTMSMCSNEGGLYYGWQYTKYNLYKGVG